MKFDNRSLIYGSQGPKKAILEEEILSHVLCIYISLVTFRINNNKVSNNTR